MKIVFPESVERELAQQQSLHTEKNTVQPFPQVQEQQELSQSQLKARNQAIQNTTSSLYTPQSPLTPEYRSKSPEIEERLQRIQKRFAALKEKEEARNAYIQRQAWLKYHNLSKPTIGDFKRPITTFFLFASAVYMTLQFTWYTVERESYVEKMEMEQSKLVDSLNTALLNQKDVVQQYQASNNNKKWWKFL